MNLFILFALFFENAFGDLIGYNRMRNNINWHTKHRSRRTMSDVSYQILKQAIESKRFAVGKNVLAENYRDHHRVFSSSLNPRFSSYKRFMFEE